MSVVVFEDICIYPNNQSYLISLVIHKNVFWGILSMRFDKISQGDSESISETDTAMNCSKKENIKKE